MILGLAKIGWQREKKLHSPFLKSLIWWWKSWKMFEICSEECSDDHDQVLPIRLMAETSKPFLVIFSHLPLVCDFGCGFGWGEPGTSPVSTIIVYKVVIVSREFLESVSHRVATLTHMIGKIQSWIGWYEMYKEQIHRLHYNISEIHFCAET